ncbi:MAG: hypothetical protein K0R50_1108 [Eubacterium sp.]|nr:hypothetical protein [Eubacterium sp.]
MFIKRLKKKATFSLIAILCGSMLLYSADNLFNITGYIEKQVESLKEKEMKFVYSQSNSFGDRYSKKTETNPDEAFQIAYAGNTRQGILQSIINVHNQQNYMLVGNNDIDSNLSINEILSEIARLNTITEDLETQINKDSYRDRKFGIYYVFSFDYTMNALKELNATIERISEAQKVPKELITAVLFREMMFLGQEDLLDGLPIIGGKSMGICQIGLENARFNEQVVHGKDSLIVNESDDQLKEMLQNPKYAVYFCAVQLRARAISLTGDPDIDLSQLDKEQLQKVMETYNQSKISVTIGPIKTKETYAQETYRYFELFKDYYNN